MTEQEHDNAESSDRKSRSQAILRNAGVAAINPWLPEIETADQIEPRSTVEIARRALCLLLVAARSELDADIVEGLIGDYEMTGYFTRDEQAYLDSNQLTQHAKDLFSWRSEASWVLLWALGFVRALGLPFEQISPGDAIEIVESNGIEGLVSNASPRSMSEILDEADLIYRCHWAVRHSDLNSVDGSGQLESGVTYERHYALNWLIRYSDQEWDDISTDT